MTIPIQTLPRPRGFIESSLLAIFLLTPMTAIICLITMAIYGMPFDGILIAIFSIHFGLIFGMLIGYFLQQRKTTVEFLDPKDFIGRLDVELFSWLYRPAECTELFRMYKSKWYSSRGRFYVRMFEDCATLVGPKYFLDKLTRKLERDL